jgi:hypothetical protein
MTSAPFFYFAESPGKNFSEKISEAEPQADARAINPQAQYLVKRR